MQSMPKVSVIMPSLNVAPYIAECIESVIAQTLQEIEILCVDAGSTDGTLEILQAYAAKDARIRLLHSDKKSYGYQMNLGMDAAAGEYMGIVETDDWVDPGMYEALWAAAENSRADMVLSNYYRYTTGSGKQSVVFENLSACAYGQVFCPREAPAVFRITPSIWSGLYRFETLRKNGIRFHESSGASYQDSSFLFMVCTAAERCLALKQPFYHYRRDNENSSVASKHKVFCISDEMHYFERFLHARPADEKRLASFCQLLKYDKYRWNYARIAPEHQWDFLALMHDEFQKADADGTLDRAYFSDEAWDSVSRIISSPVRYYRDSCKVFSAAPCPSDAYPCRVLRPAACPAPLVSVVIPAYNVEAYIGETLQSVLGQTFRDIEVICVDDGSTDGTLRVLQGCAAKDGRVCVLTQVNKGVSAARNAGLSAARGRYVQFLDSDDLMTPESYAFLYQTAEARNADVVYFNASSFYESEALRQAHPYYLQSYEYEQDLPDSMSGTALFVQMHRDAKYRVVPGLALYRRDSLQQLGLRFKEGIMHEDNLFTLQCMIGSKRVSFVKDKLLLRRVREGSIMTVPRTVHHLYGYLVCYMEILSFANALPYDHAAYPCIVSELQSISSQLCRLDALLAGETRCDAQFTELERHVFTNLISAAPGARNASRLRKAGSRAKWLPRKIRGGIQCCCDHGFVYTVHLGFQKIGRTLKKLGRRKA